jgi:hypothetical protein
MRCAPLTSRTGGRIRIKLILGLALLALGIYVGVQAAYHYWAYWNLKEEGERAAIEVAASEAGQPLARKMIIAKAREYDIVLNEQAITITPAPDRVTVSFGWQRTIELPGYIYPLSFQVTATTRRAR